MRECWPGFPWVVDGVTEMEWQAVQSISLAAGDEDRAAFARIVLGLPWVGDDFVPVGELEGIQALLSLRSADAATAQVVRNYSWVLDDMTHAEHQALIALAGLAGLGPGDRSLGCGPSLGG